MVYAAPWMPEPREAQRKFVDKVNNCLLGKSTGMRSRKKTVHTCIICGCKQLTVLHNENKIE